MSSVIAISTNTLYLIPESNFHVIHDSFILLSVMTFSTTLLYPILLYQFPASYVKPDSVMPDSIISVSIMTGSPSP